MVSSFYFLHEYVVEIKNKTNKTNILSQSIIKLNITKKKTNNYKKLLKTKLNVN